jgi:hypothetical protein
MVSPLTQSQITLPVGLDRATAREQLWWLSAACRLLETRLLQVRWEIVVYPSFVYYASCPICVLLLAKLCWAVGSCGGSAQHAGCCRCGRRQINCI